jgi:hypothetical protein
VDGRMEGGRDDFWARAISFFATQIDEIVGFVVVVEGKVKNYFNFILIFHHNNIYIYIYIYILKSSKRAHYIT